MMNTKNPLRLGRDAWGPWVPATRRLSTFSQCQCIATADVTVPLLPSEECACRLHEGVTEVLWKRYGLFSPVFPKWAHLFSLIKTGEVQKKKTQKKTPHIICKMNFSVCKHYFKTISLIPFIWSLSRRTVMCTHNFWPTDMETPVSLWVTQEASTSCTTTTSHKEISKVVWYVFFLACAVAFLTMVQWLHDLKTNWVSLQAAIAGRHCPSHHRCNWDYIRQREDL